MNSHLPGWHERSIYAVENADCLPDTGWCMIQSAYDSSGRAFVQPPAKPGLFCVHLHPVRGLRGMVQCADLREASEGSMKSESRFPRAGHVRKWCRHVVACVPGTRKNKGTTRRSCPCTWSISAQIRMTTLRLASAETSW